MDFKFELNGRTWKILEVSQEKMFDYYHEEGVGYYYGQTHFSTQEIWISNDITKDQLPKTMYHELMHCYIRMCITCQDLEFNEESLCDISANAHDFIHNVTNNYIAFRDKHKFEMPTLEEFKENIKDIANKKTNFH